MNKTFQDAVVTIRLPAPPVGVDLASDGSRVAVALAAGPGTPSLCVYDTVTGAQLAGLADKSGFGRGVIVGRGGRCLYALIEAASGGTSELRRYTLDGEDTALSTYPSGEVSGLVRNRAADLFAVLGHDVQVHHDDGTATPELVRVIPGLDPQRFVDAQFPAEGAHLYCSGVAERQVVRWSIEANRSDGAWPAPGTHGRVAVSRTGRRLIVANHGVQGVFGLDTDSGERFMPEDLDENAYTNHYAFAPDESGFAYLAGVKAGFRDWSTRERVRGPTLHDGRIASLRGAWDADVYVYAYDEARLCVARTR